MLTHIYGISPTISTAQWSGDGDVMHNGYDKQWNGCTIYKYSLYSKTAQKIYVQFVCTKIKQFYNLIINIAFFSSKWTIVRVVWMAVEMPTLHRWWLNDESKSTLPGVNIEKLYAIQTDSL